MMGGNAMVRVNDGEPISADESDRQALAEVDRLLSQAGNGLLLANEDNERTVQLPDVAIRVLRDAIHHLARGRSVTLVPVNETLTTQEAADILNVSRPYIVKLLEQGEIPFQRLTTHRRIKIDDLLAYKRRRDDERRRHLAELAQMSDELGLYDVELRPEDLTVESA
jgi:excisionase family DNA binding protein